MTTTRTTSYVVVSPCRDEVEHLGRTFDSVVAQTLRPTRWIIVDDGSTDGTYETLVAASGPHDWIDVVRRPQRASRVLGGGVVRAFDEGLSLVDLDDYDLVSKLDMDLVLPPTYYEALAERMDQDPRLGTASGRPHVLSPQGEGAEPSMVPERGAAEMSAGMAKVYRTECFRQIGGLVPEIMWDGIDCHEARRQGWRSRSFDDPQTDFVHLRPEGGSDRGVLRGRRRHGFGQYYMGTGWFFMVASALLRVRDSPALLGSLHMLFGYARAAVRRQPRYGSPEFRRELRRFQYESMVWGKRRATARWESRAEPVWSSPSAGSTSRHRWSR